MRAQAGQHGISSTRVAYRTVLRSICGILPKIAIGTLKVRLQVLEASLIAWRVEYPELDVRTDDASLSKAGHEHAFDHVSEWGEVVHEDPEAGEGTGTCEDANLRLASD